MTDHVHRLVWHAAACAPADRPVRLLQGRFIDEEGQARAFSRTALLNNGWGHAGGARLADAAPSPLPCRLALTWYALAEDRFYEGEFDVPTQRMQALAEGLAQVPGAGDAAAGCCLVAGMAPQGLVVLWLACGAHTRELARGKLPPVELDWATLPMATVATRADWRKARLLQALGEQGLRQLASSAGAAAPWEHKHRRLPWQQHLIGADAGAQLWLGLLSGEREWIAQPAHMPFGPASNSAALPPARALPARMELRHRSADGVARLTRVWLDEAETSAAFAKLLEQARPPANGLSLQLDVSQLAQGARLHLCDDHYSLELLRAKAQTWRSVSQA